MGCKEQAFDYTWLQVGQSFGTNFQRPKVLLCKEVPASDSTQNLSVVCVKYGTKYGADYVNKLFSGVKRHLPLEHTFTCFTEDAGGLDPAIRVVPLANKWQAWWSKVHIFDSQNFKPNSRVFYLDLDMIVTGDLTPLATMPV